MSDSPNALIDSLRQRAEETAFSGVVRVTMGGTTFTETRGLADRERCIPNTAETRFALASGTKGFTAAAIARLIDDHHLTLETPARDVLGARIGNLPADVTIRHLLTHTSGIGDYYDEEKIVDRVAFAQTLPLARLQATADYIPLLETAPPKSAPGGCFAYCNSGFIVLALVIETLTGHAYPAAIDQLVFRVAGMPRSGVFRYDSLPAGTALGYVKSADTWAPNSHLLPMRGGGDGGAFSTLADLDHFWDAWLSGRIASQTLVDEFSSPQVRTPDGRAYGCGFWFSPTPSLIHLEGYDPGISFRSLVNRTNGDRYTVLANTGSGAWPLVRGLDAAFEKKG